MLLCCKFAEGDSRILQMKLMRDRLKRVQREGLVSTAMLGMGAEGKEALAALSLARKLAPAGRDLQKMDALFAEHWEDIYHLAELIEERHISSTPPAAFIEPLVERLVGADARYDTEWKKELK